MQTLQGLLLDRLHALGSNVAGTGGFEQGGRVAGFGRTYWVGSGRTVIARPLSQRAQWWAEPQESMTTGSTERLANQR